MSLQDSLKHGLDLVQITDKNSLSIESHLSECKRNAHSTELWHYTWELFKNQCKWKATIDIYVFRNCGGFRRDTCTFVWSPATSRICPSISLHQLLTLLSASREQRPIDGAKIEEHFRCCRGSSLVSSVSPFSLSMNIIDQLALVIQVDYWSTLPKT